MVVQELAISENIYSLTPLSIMYLKLLTHQIPINIVGRIAV